MKDLLNFIFLNNTICSVAEKSAKTGKTMLYMLVTGISILSKANDRYKIHVQNKKIKSLEEEVKDLKELDGKVKIDVETIDANIELPSHRELIQQSKEFTAKMAEYQKDKVQLIELDKSNSDNLLLDEGENIIRSLENNEDVPIEVINDFTARFENSLNMAKEQLQVLSSHLDSFKEYVNKIFNGSSKNSFIDFPSIEKTITEIESTIGIDNFVNYGGLILIIWCLFSIITIIFSNRIFSNFQGRYYFLDRYLSYRSMFTKYYIKLEIITILIISCLMLIYNII